MRIFYAAFILAALVFSGCKGGNSNTNRNANANSTSNTNQATFTAPAPLKPVGTVDPNFQPCNPYYPLVPGSLAKYTINYSSGLVADATVVTEAMDEGGRKVFTETTQIVDRSGGYEKNETTVRKYVCNDGRVQIIQEKSDNIVQGQRNVFEHKFRGDAILLNDATSLARNGTTWAYTFNQTFQVADQPPVTPQESVTINFAAAGQEEITVPSGKFKTVKVVRKVNDAQVTDYYARGIGLVKRVSYEGTTVELREFSGLTPVD